MHGEGLTLDAAWLFAVLLILILLAAAVLASRRYLLERGGGTVECGLRLPAERGPWRLGVASYQRDDLYWYDALGVRLRPEQVFGRRTLTVDSRRVPSPGEETTLGPDRVVLEVSSAGDPVELALPADALTGFLAWLEA
ncbi:MAG: DUF2550 domain-containing protein, partial [Streptosporangiaceae bacterium]